MEFQTNVMSTCKKNSISTKVVIFVVISLSLATFGDAQTRTTIDNTVGWIVSPIIWATFFDGNTLKWNEF